MLALTRAAFPDPSPLVVLYTVLAVLAQVGVVVALVGFVLARSSDSWRTRLAPVRARVGEAGLVLATLVALIAVTGSLYLSEVAHYEPCRLCWVQRGFMYPLLPVLAVAAWRDWVSVRRIVIPWVLVGSCVSVWHIYIEINPDAEVACDPDNPCSIVWIREWGYVTIPVMALSAFFLIGTLLALATHADDDDHDHDDDEPDDDEPDDDEPDDRDPTGRPGPITGTPSSR